MELQLNDILSNIPLLKKKIAEISFKNQVDSDQLLIEMVKFLNLIHITNEKLSPSVLVDLAWHEFILFTRYYNEFCLTHYSRFIHHTPSENSEPKTFQKTIELYIKHYNKPPESIWGSYAIKEWEASDCGACHN
ncbi:hypothetical protein F7018_14030 [Tenacibaculum aiptasiae]|uniref:Uncharacterized protein n=1 Tax=Tenacibaculum aiptasiae TaxID=426481 RepID=A0A7J5AAQ7_9FLAO|nr:hypothetical protein [Tenacibaculum aiptasiae]KAB1154642.1 hypothetical protein F7018_14030 [Tenacibaculum aiptasiae]